jgi:hypothetical protein
MSKERPSKEEKRDRDLLRTPSSMLYVHEQNRKRELQIEESRRRVKEANRRFGISQFER